jgi:iron uptake system EfeUOB component EfeO/EfeM
VKTVTKLIQQGSYEQAKSLIEKTIVEYELNEPTLNMLCGEINMTLGFLIIAE